MECPRCKLGDIPDPWESCVHCGFTADKVGEHHSAIPADLEQRIKEVLEPEYRIESLLGRGGMSLVYLARELDLNRYVAMKVLPLQLSLSSDAAERFKREAKIAASLDHPHIVPIHRIGATETFLWFTMKYVDGHSLVEHLKDRGPMERRECFKIAEQVASALHYGHERGIVHRDVKPANVMVDGDGCAMVCDFGVAKGFGATEAVSLTQTGAAMGTPTYMSPEQLYGQPLDGRADQYSLAALIFELLAGRPPFVASSTGEVLRMHCLEAPPRLSEYRSDLPLRASQALARAMSKSPDQRYDNVLDLVVALGGRRPAGRTRRSDEDTQPTRIKTAPVFFMPLLKLVGIPQLMHWSATELFPHVRWLVRLLRRGWAWLGPRLRRLAVGSWRSLRWLTKSSWRALKWLARGVRQLPHLLHPAQIRRLPQVLRSQWHSGLHQIRQLPRRIARRLRSKQLRFPPGYASLVAAVVLLSGISINLASQGAGSWERPVHSPPSEDALTAMHVQLALGAGQLTVAAITEDDSAATAADSVAASADSVETALVTAATRPRATTPRPRRSRPRPARAAPTPTVAAEPPPAPDPPAAVKPRDHRAEIGAVIDRFVSAIESRDVDRLRRVHSSLTEQDGASWATFFESAQGLKMTATVARLDIRGSGAEALLDARYDYTRGGEPRNFDVHLVVTFERTAAGWSMKSVRTQPSEG